MKTKRKKKTVILLATAILVVVLLRSGAVTSFLIPSSGMENSLYQGEGILVNKWSYGLRLPLMKWLGYRRWGAGPVRHEDIIVFNNPGNLSEPVPDRREVFISRCVGLPGDTLQVDSLFNIVSGEPCVPDQKFLYTYPRSRESELDSLLASLSISSASLSGQDQEKCVRSLSRYEYYLLQQAIASPCWIVPLHQPDSTGTWHPLVVPGRGEVVRVRPWNIALLRNTLVLHEHRQAEIRNDTLWVDGKPVQQCHFTKDYYWVVSSNSVNFNDSRLFGLVPEDHLIGKATRIWFSKVQGTGLFGGYRWERIGMKVR